MKSATVFKAPRIGLNDAKDNEHGFAKRPYRFVIFLNLPHRETEKMKIYLTTGENKQLSEEDYKAIRTGSVIS